MARRSPALLVAVAAAAAVAACHSLLSAFVSPSAARREAVLGGLAGLVASSTIGASPAQAEVANFGFFGLGEGISDAYNQNDADQKNPYSPFSGGSDADNLYKPYGEEFMAKKRKVVADSRKRLNTLEDAISTQQSEAIKMEMTRQMGTLMGSMNYLAAGVGTQEVKKANKAAQEDLQQFLVYSKQKKWTEAKFAYNSALAKMDKFMECAGGF